MLRRVPKDIPNSLCIKVYSNSQANHHFVVGLGQSFGKDWIHVISDELMIPRLPWEDSAEHNYNEMLVRSPEHAQHINKARSGAKCSDGQICIMQTRLPQTTRLLQISSVMRKSSRTCVVKLELFHNPGFGDISGEWITFGVIVGSFARLIGTGITIYLGNRLPRP